MRDYLEMHFQDMVRDVDCLFAVRLDTDELWQTYLSSFPEGTNPMYRERTVHDCSCCRDFVRRVGNAVSIKDGALETIWDFETDDDVYAPVLKAMDAFVRDRAMDPDGIENVYLSSFKNIGAEKTFEINEGDVTQWDHFHLELDRRFYERHADRIGGRLGEYRTSRDVLQRSLEEISFEAIDTVLELIDSNTLYRGQEWKAPLEQLRQLKTAYEQLNDHVARNLFLWEKSAKVGPAVGRIRNHSLGVLLTDITGGMPLDDAVRRYEAIVAPSNYRRSKPIYTQAMLEKAQQAIIDMGFMEALPRRHAKLDDITVNDILFSDKTAAKRIQGAADIFGELAKTAKDAGSPKKFTQVDEIGIEKFLEDVLPHARSLEVYLANDHIPNMVSLIAPQNEGARSMFKWGNNFTWAYSGNMTDSMKQRVKAFGGKVDGDLRFSIQWNEDGTDNCDVDAHCIEASGEEIYYGNKRSSTNGELDVDIIEPMRQVQGEDKTAVENITWATRKTMKAGTYRFFVHQYAGSASKGFRAEIEFDGIIYSFDYPHSMSRGQRVQVADVTLGADGGFTIKTFLDPRQSKKTVWGLETNEFVPVTVVCYSPNWWSTADHNTGHKHVFFMLQGCVNDERPSGLFNEFLVPELYEHRRVMEALSGKMRVEETDDQLSGIGFALDKRAELIVKVTGATERILKVKF